MATVVPVGDPLPPYGYGPPYPPQVAVLGLIPTVRVDVPLCIVLIVFFVAGAAVNLAIFVRNKACDHKFLPSSILVGFCVTRIIALSLRIAWATQPWNISLNIAASIFAAAGVVLLFALNLLFTHRLLCGLHPNIGWLPVVGNFFLFCYFLIIVCLICAVTALTVSFYTLVPEHLHDCRIVQLFTSTTLALIAFLPIPILLCAAFYPGLRRPEPFGYGSLTTKIILVLATATLLTIGAAYRCAVNYAVRPVWFPGWWHHKACYYVFNYDLELVVVFAYALMRFDLRFHVPDGARKAGDYLKGQHAYKRVSSLAFRASLDERITVRIDGRRRRASSRTEYFTPSGNLARSNRIRTGHLPRADYLSQGSYLSGSGGGSRSSRSSRSEEISNEINGGRDVRETRHVFRERVYEKKLRGRPTRRRSSRERKRSHERRRRRR
ncbi:family C-like G-protein-coupled receptor protein [Colletotrichum tofieldiae]|uniref:Family C-like G-protein-coupled receptor protein n=1 Tax=Colletotrichum tofieldiae TaxID=708197 RepID=A0A166VUZ8_9PEZI|nr:family C-like G-protein-coupled receptor protein [Colletotrichum tofieldiae]GKT59331.1 family C-like G-protein-coupled receptor protein [Colletotrichum tofieldiae]GKT79955.1 family C-like G-protein-coupled receptor protein [Colletotrichum tofieldiae]GKT85488.1 family C-like G-protein-coupled receptor protein [Colletotrichum tofieldiae]